MGTMQSTEGEARLAARATGAMFFSVFGAVWLAGWAHSAGHGVAWIVPIVVLAAVLFGVARQRHRRHASALAQVKDSPEWQRGGRVFGIVNSVQWIVIVVLGIVMGNTGYGAWIIPMAIGIIGLHFFPLAVVFRNPPHYVTGAALVALAILYPLLAGPTSPVGFLGAGIILWLSAAWALRPGRTSTS